MKKKSKIPGQAGRKKFVSSRLTVIIGVFLLVFISVSLAKEIVRRYEVNREIKNLQSEISELEERNTELTSLITFFNTDAFLEQEARTRLSLQKPGEKVMIIPDVDLTTEEEQKKNIELSLSNPRKWYNFFFQN